MISGHADHYTAIPKRQRKRTIVEELLQDDKFKKYVLYIGLLLLP